MSREFAQLGLEVDAAIRAVPGVAALFSADPVLVRTARELTAGAQEVALSQVAEGDEGLTITASAGVIGDDQAPATAKAVADAIRGTLPPERRDTAAIHVRISRVAI